MFLTSPLGTIRPPPTLMGGDLSAIGPFISRLIGLALILGGLFILVNLITAGYLYVQGGQQNLTKAWDKIWQSLLGMIIMAMAVLITGIISWFIFEDPAFLLNPTIPSP